MFQEDVLSKTIPSLVLSSSPHTRRRLQDVKVQLSPCPRVGYIFEACSPRSTLSLLFSASFIRVALYF